MARAKLHTGSRRSIDHALELTRDKFLHDLKEFLTGLDPNDPNTTLLTQRALRPFADGHSAEKVEEAVSKAVTNNPRIDGRTLRKTNRTVPLSLRVTPEFDLLLRKTAQADGILLAEVMERSLALYTKKDVRSK